MSSERSHDGDPYDLAGAMSDQAQDDEPQGDRAGRRLRPTAAAGIRPRRIRWLWDGRVVAGGLTLLAGREGLGKSTIAVELAAQVTRGRLDGEHHGTPRSVVYVNSEDARDFTIVPRLIAAGADLDRVFFVDAVSTGEDGVEVETPIVLPLDAAALTDTVRDVDAVLIVLDAATSVIEGRLDGNQDRQMRQGLERIAKVAEHTGAAVLGLVHFGKRAGADTGKLILGSIAWSQVARSVLALAADEEDQEGDDDLILSATKANLAGRGVPSLALRIVSADVATDDGPASVGRVDWRGETNVNARTLLAGDPDGAGNDRQERDAAVAWLEDFLTVTDKAPSADVKKAAKGADIAERTLQRARVMLDVQISSEGMPRRSYWRLPDRSDPSDLVDDGPSGAARSDSGTTGESGSSEYADAQVTALFPSDATPLAPLHAETQSCQPPGTTAQTAADQQEHPAVDRDEPSRANARTHGATGTWRVSGDPIDGPA